MGPTGTDGSPDDGSRVVGRIGRAHGLSGDVVVQVHTDSPEQRFTPGARLGAGAGRSLTVESTRSHSGALLIRFEGVSDRTTAQELRGRWLTVDAGALPELPDPDEYYDHQLEGLTATSREGAVLGTVREVVHAPASDLLVLDTGHGTAMVPFVRAIVPEVDVAAGRLTLDPPDGLLD